MASATTDTRLYRVSAALHAPGQRFYAVETGDLDHNGEPIIGYAQRRGDATGFDHRAADAVARRLRKWWRIVRLEPVTS